MSDFYDRMYEDPVKEIVEKDRQYREWKKELVKLEAEVWDMLRGQEQVKEALEKLLDVIYRMEGCANKALYLKGAEDRGKMLDYKA